MTNGRPGGSVSPGRVGTRIANGSLPAAEGIWIGEGAMTFSTRLSRGSRTDRSTSQGPEPELRWRGRRKTRSRSLASRDVHELERCHLLVVNPHRIEPITALARNTAPNGLTILAQVRARFCARRPDATDCLLGVKGSQPQILSARPMSADRPTLILLSQPPFQGILPLVSETLESDVVVELNLAPSESLWCGARAVGCSCL